LTSNVACGIILMKATMRNNDNKKWEDDKMPDLGEKKISEIMNSPETKLGEYVVRLQLATRAGEVDQDKLISLVLAAKGSRSMRKFADDMGVNVSSISRIVNGKVTEISDTLLAKIAFHADPASGVTLEQLMEAQGIVDQKDQKNLARRYEEDCRRIVADELLKRGYSVTYPQIGLRTFAGSNAYDFEIITDAIPHGGGRWLIETKMMTEYSRYPVGSGRTGLWLDSAMAMYYRGEHVARISLIIDHKVMYEQLKDRLSRLSIADEISIILISTKQGKILDEYVVPLSDGRTPVYALTGAGYAGTNE